MSTTSEPESEPPLQSWQVLHSRVLLDRRPWLRVVEEDVLLSNERRIPDYLLAEGRDYTAIFALTFDYKIPLVGQYKHGVKRICFDVPGGYLDTSDEPPLICARRELAEELGLVSDDWRHLASLVIDSNRGLNQAHIFLALSARRAVAVNWDDTESLVYEYCSTQDVHQRVLRGEIDSLSSVAAVMLSLDYLRNNRHKDAAE